MANKPGDQVSKYRRNLDIILAYDKGEDPESLSKRFHMSQRQIFRIVSYKNRLTMAEWAKELGQAFGEANAAIRSRVTDAL